MLAHPLLHRRLQFPQDRSLSSHQRSAAHLLFSGDAIWAPSILPHSTLSTLILHPPHFGRKMESKVSEGGLNVTLTIRLLMHGKVQSGQGRKVCDTGVFSWCFFSEPSNQTFGPYTLPRTTPDTVANPCIPDHSSGPSTGCILSLQVRESPPVPAVALLLASLHTALLS